ncbi:non-muscle cofilin 1-like [Morone saxatilis]|uniref:non-muscle cofilin 1-like n=1 Tax=Morone saxatilis TaxID=34816 RepID=UPI0015E22342|nr:non-muscle cofilin 1-like [Morone saxatilis]
MASGVKVADRVKGLYNDMKLVKNDADQNERIRIVVFGFIDDNIDVEEKYLEKDLEGKDVFKFYQSLLEPKKCRYILYDCHFETKEASVKEELVFALWCPDSARIKEKMNYASSKEALKKAMPGLKHDLQLNDFADCSTRDIFADKLGKNIVKLEGHPMHPTGQS